MPLLFMDLPKLKCLHSRKIRFLTIFFYLLIFNQVRAQQAVNVDVHSMAACEVVRSFGHNNAEKSELQKDYWTLLGIMDDLAKYRQSYIRSAKLIDAFPTAYYDEVQLQCLEILSGAIVYPDERMKQITTVYNAYKSNRNFWVNGEKSKVEPQWHAHFSFCESADTDCAATMLAISGGLVAQYRFDLPRALWASYKERFQKNLVYDDKKYREDFLYAGEHFKEWARVVRNNIGIISKCSRLSGTQDGDLKKEMGALAYSADYAKDITTIFLDGTLLDQMKSSWKTAFARKGFLNGSGQKMDDQPYVDQDPLIAAGMAICPDPAMRIDMPKTAEKPSVKSIAVPIVPEHSSVDLPDSNSGAVGNNNKNGTPAYSMERAKTDERSRPRAPLSIIVPTPTPEALGKAMLEAVRTNNKKLWVSLIHPNNITYDMTVKALENVRMSLEERGLTDWASVRFSRVVFSINPAGSKLNGAAPDGPDKGEQRRWYFKVEFTYKDKLFVGFIGDIFITTFKKNFLMSYSSDATMVRY